MNRLLYLLPIAGLIVLVSCSGGSGSSSSSGGTNPTSGQANVSASMIDAPFRTSGGTVTAVAVAVSKVELIGSGGIQTLATFSPSQEINLLNFQSAPGIALGSAAIPAGTYQQARLVLDDSTPSNNTVTVNGTAYDLTIPSATGPTSSFNGGSSIDSGDGPGTAGIKVNLGLVAAGGQTYSILIDFNAAESIVQAGNSGQWIMKPVLVASAYASGNIGGTVTMAGGTPISNAEILAQQNGATINSGVTAADGTYAINALPQGSYSIVINNAWTNQAGQAEAASPSNGVTTGTCPNAYAVTTGQTAVSVTENPTASPSASPSASLAPTSAPPFVCSP